MKPELQDVFKLYGDEFRKTHRLPMNQLKTISAIESCRTSSLGGHVDECDSCGHVRISYNSCRNRHCPKCQGLAKERWLLEREQDLLDTGYFHVVFTIPDALNPLALRNQRTVYGILFRAAAETLSELARDPKYLGAQIGVITVLHTWGQNLLDHPHLHCIVPGGGLSFDGNRWLQSKKKFFLPVKVLSRKFRGKFLAFLKEAYHDGKLSFPGKITSLASKRCFQELLERLYDTEWIVYCKKPFKTPWHVLNYLGRYTHRVALTNNRILDISNKKVAFRWRDYRDNNKSKQMTLDAEEFIRRFLLHILPKRFVKIRHYGILSSRNRNRKLRLCQRLTHSKIGRALPKMPSVELFKELTGIDLNLCPCCGKGRMLRRLSLFRAPPQSVTS